MIIKKLVIYGYGKWIDQEFDLNSSFHLFFGENEAGKSTLMSFIHSILFGFPTRHSSMQRYEPKTSSRYGGKLIIQDKRFGEVSIERVLGKVTGDVTVMFEDGSTGDDAALAMLLRDKTRHFYESIYSFDLKGIENIHQLNREQLDRFFLSIGALGHEKFLEQSDKYASKATKLFKPTGRKPYINQLAQKLKEKKRVVDEAKEKNEEYINLIRKNITFQEKLTETEDAIESNEKEQAHLKELKNHKETLEEILQLKEEIKRLPDSPLPEDGLYQLKQFNREIDNYHSKISELQNTQRSIQEKYRPSKELLVYQEYEEELNQFEKELDHWDQVIQKVKLDDNDLSNIKQQMTEIQIRENLSFEQPIPEELTQADKHYLNKVKQTIDDLQSDLTETEREMHSLKYRLDINDDMIDKIEQSLWPLSKFNEAREKESLIQNEKRPEKNKNRVTDIGLIVVSLVLLTGYLLTFNYLYLGGFILSIVVVFFLFMTEKKNDSIELSSEEMNKYYQQKNLRGQWKELLAKNDVLQSDKETKENDVRSLEAEMTARKQSFDEWKQRKHYPQATSLHYIENKADTFKKLKHLAEKEQSLTSDIQTALQTLADRLDSMHCLEKLAPSKDSHLEEYAELKRLIKNLKQEQQEQKDYIKETDSVQREIQYYVQKEREYALNKQHFLQSLNAASDEAVHELYRQQEEKHKKENRLALLNEKLPKREQDSEEVNVENIESKRRQLDKTLTSLKHEQKQLMKKSMEIELQIRNLEDGGTYTELLQEYENEKSVYQEAVDEWSTYKAAASLIEKTLHFAKEDKLPQTIQTAEMYFSYLTGHEYEKVIFEDDTLYVIDKYGNKWHVNELSRGTVEPLYIAMRLAFIQNTKDTIQFPVIIDDPFVNLDSSRVNKMFDLLTKYVNDIQIIYFSFDERIIPYISKQNYSHIK